MRQATEVISNRHNAYCQGVFMKIPTCPLQRVRGKDHVSICALFKGSRGTTVKSKWGFKWQIINFEDQYAKEHFMTNGDNK